MKYMIILSAFVMLTEAQRPSYASSGPIGRPGLHSRFKTDNATTTSSTTVSVVNRVGEDGSTPKIPVDARGDIDLVNTLNSWDRDHQPFWFINAQHIEKARNTTRGTQQTGQNQISQTTQLPNRNQIDSQRNRGSSRGNQGSLQDSQSNFLGSQGSFQGNRGSFQGGQTNFEGTLDGLQGNRGRISGGQVNQMGRQPQGQDNLPNRARTERVFQTDRRVSNGFVQNEENFNGHRHNDMPFRFEYRRNFYDGK